MRDQNLKRIVELAERLKREPRTRENALSSLRAAGIVDESGQFTEPYKELEALPLYFADFRRNEVVS